MLSGPVTYRKIGISIVVMGLALVVLALAADSLGLGSSSGLGRAQIVGISLGVLIAVGGMVLAVLMDQPVSRSTWLTIVMFAVLGYFVLSLWSIFHLVTGQASISRVVDTIASPFSDSEFLPEDGTGTTIGDASDVFKLGNPEDQYYYFPYGFLGNFPDYSSHPMGFRVQEEISTFRENHPNDRIVVVLGGSSAFGWFVGYEDTPWYTLEQLLNNDESLSEYRGDGEFKVLNLSMPSDTVISEMSYYLLFAEALQPDLVIAHNGYNDLLSSQFTDPYFLDKYGITYARIGLAKWAQILQEFPDSVSNDDLNSETELATEDPDLIVDSYYMRVSQLKSIVERTGAVFVSGLQPHLSSKSGMCGSEKQWGDSRLQLAGYQALPSLYDLYVDRYIVPLESASDTSWVVDFHTEFQQFGADECIFFDNIHVNETGSRVIAESFHARLQDLLTDPAKP